MDALNQKIKRASYFQAISKFYPRIKAYSLYTTQISRRYRRQVYLRHMLKRAFVSLSYNKQRRQFIRNAIAATESVRDRFKSQLAIRSLRLFADKAI